MGYNDHKINYSAGSGLGAPTCSLFSVRNDHSISNSILELEERQKNQESASKMKNTQNY
jgi:hypothetical protein